MNMPAGDPVGTASDGRPDVTYHGRPAPGPATIEILTDGKVTGVVTPVLHHSPTGISWGYAGSGPADCARSILIHTLGEQAKCPACDGTQVTVYDDMIVHPGGQGRGDYRPWIPADGPIEDLDPELSAPCWCNGGYRDLPYQRFKFAFVATWPQAGEWTMTRAEILTWLDQQPDWNLP